MPLPLSLGLIILVVVVVVLRAMLPVLPLRAARPIARVDAVVSAVGLLGLALHCGAMFYQWLIDAIPGTSGYVAVVNSMGAGSIVLYVIPAVLLLVGLRHQPPPARAVLLVALVLVGITMYNGGPLTVHLAAIAAAVIIITLIGGLLVGRPGDRSPARVIAGS